MRRVDAPDDAIELLPRRARIYGGQLGGTPTGLLDALARHRDRFEAIELVTGYLVDPIPPHLEPGPPFRFVSLQPSGATRRQVADGTIAVVPARFSEFAPLLSPGGPLAVDVVLVAVSRPGPSGRFSLGTSVGVTAELVERAPLVVAAVNPHMPYTYGAGEIEAEDIDVVVEIDEPLPALPTTAIDDVSAAIAELVVDLVPDGATVQFGIGAVPEATLGGLVRRSGLALHGGLVSPAARALVDAGGLRGPVRAAEALGDAELYEWLDRNPSVEMIGSRISHGAAALAGLPRLVALNSGVEVALDGSVNSEIAGGRRISGPGGAPDFAAAASLSAGARSIIALPARARGGAASRIVRSLDPPAVTTIGASFADVVVTEFGVAELRGRTLDQRASALAAIAHPDFRADLSPATAAPGPGPHGHS